MNQQDFLQAILADPEADTPRLIYADWLEEQGNPRGEFIRAQISLLDSDLEEEERQELKYRETELLREHESEWLKMLMPYLIDWRFHRGFVEYIRVTASVFINQGQDLFDTEPVRSASFVEIFQVDFATLMNTPSLRMLAGLNLASSWLGIKDAELLAGSPYMVNLKKLLLEGNGLGAGGVQALAKSANLPRLELLELSGNALRNDAVVELAASPHYPLLTTLLLRNNSIRGNGAKALASSPYLQNLTYLDLRGNPLSRRAMDALRERFGKAACEF